MNKQYVASVLGISLTTLTVAFSAGCGKSSSSSSSGPTSVSSMFGATDPVTSSSTAGIALEGVSRKGSAATGLVLGNLTSSSLTGTNSRGACEVSSTVRDALRDAASPDKIRCYIGVLEKKGLISNFYDGSDHTFKLLAGGSEMLRVKVNVTKDSSGGIASFKEYECSSNGNGNAKGSTSVASGISQEAYNGTVLSSGSATITAVQVGSYSGNTSSLRVVASGAFSGSGWSNKSIKQTQNNASSFSGNTWNSNSYTTIDQTAVDSMTVGTYRTSSGAFSGNNFSETLQFTSLMQIIGGTKLSTIAMGDGSVNYSVTQTYNGSSFPGTGYQSWSGDTLNNVTPATGGANYSSLLSTVTANGGLPSTTPTTVTFGTGETWDCSLGSATQTVDLTGICSGNGPCTDADMVVCDAKYGLGSNNYSEPDCHNLQ